MTTPPIRKSPASRREAGSAYVLVLIVLLVLTLLALVLALITQSEVEVGSNERTINRVFYSAEAGVTASVAAFLYGNSREGFEMTFLDPGSTVFGTHVEVAPMNQVNYGPCNLCEVNQNTQYVNVTHEVSATATRFGKDANGNETVLARKRLDLMVAIQPLQLTNPVDTFDGEKRP